MASLFSDEAKKNLFITIGLLFLAVLVYAQFGFNGKLARDDAIWLYGGQQMAQGIPPYVSIFDFKSPFGPMLAAAAAWLAYQTGGDDVLYVRLLFFLLSCLTVVSLYYLMSALFQRRDTAILAAVVFLCFWGFCRHAGSGPQVKTAMVLLQILALYYTSQGKWFLAGLSGSLAAWTWQPAVIFPLSTLILAFFQLNRGRAILRTLVGGALPCLVIIGYFMAKGSFSALLQGAVLFNLQQLHRSVPLLQQVKAMAQTLTAAFPIWIFPMMAGLFVIAIFYFWRYRRCHNSWRELMQNDPFAGLLLTFPFPFIWSSRDFQGYDDFFIFLPYAAVGIAASLSFILTKFEMRWLLFKRYRRLTLALISLLLVGQAVWFYRQKNHEIGSYLLQQKEWTRQIEKEYLHQGELVSIGTPELMVLSHRRNRHRFLYIVEGIDDLINQETAGGFEGWLKQIADIDPAVIGFKFAPGRFMGRLQDWLRAHYHETRVGDWTLYLDHDSR